MHGRDGDLMLAAGAIRLKPAVEAARMRQRLGEPRDNYAVSAILAEPGYVRQRDLGVGRPVVVVGEQVQPVENWALVEAVQHALDQAVEERARCGGTFGFAKGSLQRPSLSRLHRGEVVR